MVWGEVFVFCELYGVFTLYGVVIVSFIGIETVEMDDEDVRGSQDTRCDLAASAVTPILGTIIEIGVGANAFLIRSLRRKGVFRALVKFTKNVASGMSTIAELPQRRRRHVRVSRIVRIIIKLMIETSLERFISM